MPQKSHFGDQKASASVLRMICCNHALMGDFMGSLLQAPPCTVTNQMFHGATASFRGPGALGPHIIQPLQHIGVGTVCHNLQLTSKL